MSGGIIDFDSELSRHTEFFGRQDVIAKIDGYIDGPGALPRGWVLLLGGPGVGKSAILAQVLERLGRSVPHHLIRRGFEGWDRPEVIVQNLRAQIEERFPGLRRAETSLQGGLYGLLKRVSEEELFRDRRLVQRLILILDGLDETASDGSDKSPLPRFLPSHLPPGVVILCASRPTHLRPDWLDQRDGVRSINLDREWSSSNREAIRILFERSARDFSPPLEHDHVEDAIKRADGNLLYAVRLLELLKQQPPEQRTTRAIPKGLSGLFEKTWADIHALDPARCKRMMRGLSVLCSAREPLPMYLFSEIIDSWTAIDSDAFLRVTRPILFQEPSQRAYRLYHEYFREVIAENLSPTELLESEQLLAKTIAMWPPKGRDPNQRSYALRHAVGHRLKSGDIHDAQSLCLDVGYLDEKCREVGVAAVEQDLEAAVRAGGALICPELSDISTAVSLEASKLHVDRSALPVLLYNRLFCAGWPAERIERVLRFPSGLPALRLLYPVQLGTTLFRTLRGHEKAVVACSLVPGGRLVLSASSDRMLRLWALGSGECVGVLSGHTDEITSCATLSDGRRAASTSLDGTARVWDLEERRELYTLSNEDRWATACAVTPDDRYIVVGSDDGVLRFFDLETRALVHRMPGHAAYVTSCVAISSDRCVSASRDGSVRLWDLASGKLLQTLWLGGSPEESNSGAVEESRWITALTMVDESQVIITSGDGSIDLWDIDSALHKRSRIGGQGRVDACAVTSDGRLLLCGMADGAITLWDLASERRIDHMDAHTASVSACVILPGSQRAVTASHDGTLKLLELATLETVRPREQHTEAVSACALSRSGTMAVSTSKDKTVKILDLTSGAQRTLARRDERINACALSAADAHILLGAQNGGLILLDMADGALIDELRGHTASITGCAFVSGERILSTSEDRTLRLWDRTLRVHRILEDRKEGLVGCATTPDGAKALVMGRSGAVTIWDFATGDPTRASHRLPPGLHAGALSSDGRLGVFGFENGMIEIYEFPSGKLRRAIKAHTEGIFGCTTSPDQARVISVSKDRTLRVHCIHTGNHLASIPSAVGFRCVTASKEQICAGDEAGNVWIVAPNAAVIDRTSPPRKDSPRQTHRPSANKPAPSAISKTQGPARRKPAPARQIPSTPKPAYRFSGEPSVPPLISPTGERARSRTLQGSSYTTTTIADLRDVLAEVYPTSDQARLIASDIKLNLTRCDLSGSSQLLWQEVLEEARRQDCLNNLIERVRKEYPVYEPLTQALRAFGRR